MIKFVTDSTSNIPENLLELYNITVVPSYIFFENKEYREGVNISYEDFCKFLTVSKNFPMSAPPASSEFLKVYQEISKDVDSIFSIHISSNLSNIYKFASIAADIFNKQKREKLTEVEVIDSQSIDMGLGMIVLEAARFAKLNENKEEIKKVIEKLKKKMRFYIYVEKIEYLIKGGRVRKLTGMLANLLNIKPILSVENGEILNKGKVRDKENAKEFLLNLLSSEINSTDKIKVAVLDAFSKEEGDNLLQEIKKRFNCEEIFRNNFSTTVTLHLGPGALGVAFYKD
jgi:DegV family protein with EDD domain